MRGAESSDHVVAQHGAREAVARLLRIVTSILALRRDARGERGENLRERIGRRGTAEEIVAPRAFRGVLLARSGEGDEKGDQDLARAIVTAELASELHAVESERFEVEHDQIGREARAVLQRFDEKFQREARVRDATHGAKTASAMSGARERFTDGGLAVDHQDFESIGIGVGHGGTAPAVDPRVNIRCAKMGRLP